MGEGFKPLDIETARKLAQKWTEKLGECCCSKIDVVAGVYRGKNPTRDVDLICLPKNVEALRDLNPVKEDSVRIVYNDEGAKIEVWVADEATYELKKWYRRLPKEKFIELASRAKANQMTLSWQKGLIDSEGNIITTNPQKIEQILANRHSI